MNAQFSARFLSSCARSPCNLCCNPPLFMLLGDMLGLVSNSRWRAGDKGELFRKSHHKPNLESTSKYGFSPDLGGKNGGVLSMRMQVILDSSFARPGSAPIWGGKKGEFRDWTRFEDNTEYPTYYLCCTERLRASGKILNQT